MKKLITTCLVFLSFTTTICGQWQPVGNKIKTEWASKVNPDNVLPEYPRPIMVRDRWQNLNGLWEYSIIKRNEPARIVSQGHILVPFAIESSLSGVARRVSPEEELVYRRTFTIDKIKKDERLLLHFGAADWKAEVWVNDVKIGQHTGGFTPFHFDITDALKTKGANTLTVKVWDPIDKGYQPRGKQVSHPDGIWYTPVTGIWQTVWLEPVSKTHITRLKITPDIDQKILSVLPETENLLASDIIKVEVFDKNKLIASKDGTGGKNIEIKMPEDIKLWSPDNPYLYDLRVSIWRDGKQKDRVESYAAMRKFSSMRDASGIMRMALNNRPLFQFGPLDQGWWPDGLYTAPTDEALAYDIQKTKDFGFNMIRKHIKVEPARWYTYCDRMGIIVWQDMPSGDNSPQWQNRNYFNGEEMIRSEESEACYRKEWKEIIDELYSYPCICTWVPFNEAWGQFKTPEISTWTKAYDPTRIVNPASGGNHYKCGDILDLHNYPAPELYLYDPDRITVLGEYGGIGLVLKDHLWEPERNWGYVNFNSEKDVTDEYEKYIRILQDLIPKGFSAAVYTQTTDVEIEVNGLMTYDRKVIKIDQERIRKLNEEVCSSLSK